MEIICSTYSSRTRRKGYWISQASAHTSSYPFIDLKIGKKTARKFLRQKRAFGWSQRGRMMYIFVRARWCFGEVTCQGPLDLRQDEDDHRRQQDLLLTDRKQKINFLRRTNINFPCDEILRDTFVSEYTYNKNPPRIEICVHIYSHAAPRNVIRGACVLFEFRALFMILHVY